MHALTTTLLSLFLFAPLAPGWLGVYLATDTDAAKVAEVIPGTPAEKAGLQKGDLLLAVDDTKTATREAFIEAIQGHQAGDRIKLRIERKGKQQVVVVRLGKRPENPGAGAVRGEVEEAPPALETPRIGGRRGGRGAPAVEVAPAPRLPAKGRGYLGLSVSEADGGLVIDRVLSNGPCAESGLKQGDVIRSIGDQRVRNLEDLDRVLRRLRPGQKVQVVAANGPRRKVVNVELGRRPGGRATVRTPVATAPAVEEPAKAAPAPVVVGIDEQPEAVVGRVRGGRGPGKPRQNATDRDLQRELRELRREIRALRKMLEELRKDKGGE